MANIDQARFPDDLQSVLDIWREYVASPSVSLDYQDNETEFAAMPGKYAPPHGCILLARGDNGVDGCIAFRPIDDRICEMKRLYVRPRARGSGLGKLLVSALIMAARHAGYAEMRLDVLAEFAHAQRLYAELGFVEAAPVAVNPVAAARFLGLRL